MIDIKELVKQTLRKFNREIIYTHGQIVTGYDLYSDLRSLITAPKPVCFDVGANTGQTISILLSAFNAPIIHAFEPSLISFEELEKNHYPDNVYLNSKALGEKAEKRNFINYQESQLSSFLNISEQADVGDIKKVVSKHEVEVITLDQYISETNISYIDYLKIDAQGFENQVIKGGADAISEKKIFSICVEFDFVQIYESQDDAWSICRLLTNLGYRFTGIYEINRRHNAIGWCNGLFIL